MYENINRLLSVINKTLITKALLKNIEPSNITLGNPFVGNPFVEKQCGFNCKLIIVNADIKINSDNNTIFLDPAGSAFSGSYETATWGGGGVSNILYKHVKNDNSTKIEGTYLKNHLTKQQFEDVKARKAAAFVKYKNCGVIHVISEAFGSNTSEDKIKNELTKSYKQVYDEYVAKIKGAQDFRMVVLSGGLFSGGKNNENIIRKLTPSIICDIFKSIDVPVTIYLLEFDSDKYNKLIE